MPNTIHKTLDPLFETVGLLFESSNSSNTRQNIIRELTELGMDGESFYSQHLKIWEKYMATFRKHRVAGPEDELFFGEEDPSFLLILLSLVIGNRQLITSFDNIKDSDIADEVVEICKKLFESNTPSEQLKTLDSRILFLEGLPLPGSSKWRLIRILLTPKPLIKNFLDSVNRNMEAFKIAESEVEKPLARLLDRYQTSIDNKNSTLFFKFRDSLSNTAEIYPSLIFPLSVLMFESSCYFGLLSDLVLKNGESGQQTKETLLLKLKALSDRSKLEILCSLKANPKYNLEIAEQLGLTAATMSHHMSVLLTCGFVNVQKRDGRVYYHLEQETVRQFIDSLEKTLL